MRQLSGRIFLMVIVALLLVLPARGVRAEWIEDGAPVCTAAGNRYDVETVSDGAGGAIIAWFDARSGNFDIYAQRVDASGDTLWTLDGVPICTATGDQMELQMVSDGSGGAILTWVDTRSGNFDIYAQKVLASGSTFWVADGIWVCTDSDDQYTPQIVSDGSGGAIIAWIDNRNGDYDIYVQRVNSGGAPVWAANGKGLCTATGNQSDHAITSDGAGGAIITWCDERGVDDDIYAQRVSFVGSYYWSSNGEALCTATGGQTRPQIVSDDAGGAIVTWEDWRSGLMDIYAQRVLDSGSVSWTADGVAVCSATGNQANPKITTDGEKGAIIVWEDGRGTGYDIYAQRADSSGTVQWGSNGVPLCTDASSQYNPEIISDDAGGANIAWRTVESGDWDIYALRVDASGDTLWAYGGVAVCTATGDQQYHAMASDGSGGAIIAWNDERSGGKDIYALRVLGSGAIGRDVPSIRSVSDVPNDQGGRIELQWDRCFPVTDPDPSITYYSVWRRLPKAMSALAPGAAGAQDMTADFSGRAYRMPEGSSDYAWEWLANIPAKQIDVYAYMVESRYDSTSSDTGWQYFVVTGHTADVFVYYDSPPDSGYSVDNLSPVAPLALAAEFISASELYIHWNPNTEGDLHHYAVYRGATSDFVPDELSRIGTSTDTSLVDSDAGGEYYYKVSAIDVHENESSFSLLTPEMITGVPGGRQHYENALFQNAPNPFLSSTRIAFSLKEAGHVQLRVFDAKGRLVHVLVDEIRVANKYLETWDGRNANGRAMPAGMYFYSIEAPGWKSSKKMTLAR